MSASRIGSKESKDSKLPALLTPASPTSTTGYKQSPPSSSPSYGGGKLKSNHPQAGSLPHLPPTSARAAEAEEELPATAQLSHSTSKAALDQLFAELVDPLNKGVVGYKDFSWLHTRLMFYNGRPTSITDRLQSLGGTYPQQVFRKFDLNQDTLLDKAEWQEYANSLVSVVGRAYLKDACKGLLREQQEQEAKKVAGANAWRFDDQASRQLLEKVSCAQHLGHEHEEVIEGLLRKFADPNQVDRLGNSVLWHAASKSEVGCMARLLEHGGSASHAGQHMDSPILAAARARKLQVLRLLMLGDLGENGIDSEETTLHSQQLIDKASELTAKDARELFMKVASVNYRNDRGWSPLTAAVFWNNHEYVECLIKLPHKCPRTALQADLPDSRGRTALHVAARKGLTDLVPLVLGSRANPNARDSDGWTALHHAVFNGHSETVMKLLDGQADPKIMDEQGFTPGMLMDSPNRSSRPLSREAVKALSVPDGIKFVETVLPILKNEAMSPYQKVEALLDLPGVAGLPSNLRLRDQLFSMRRGPTKVLLTKLWEVLGRELLPRLRNEKTELNDSGTKDATYWDQRAERLQNQIKFVEYWLADTTGPPRSVEWGWDNREGYREELNAMVSAELGEFCKEAQSICDEAFEERGGEELEMLPIDATLVEGCQTQSNVHVPLVWLKTKDIFNTFEGLRAVKAFGERNADDTQALTAFMELVSTDPDFMSGTAFWKNIYRLWLSHYAKQLNSDFQTKVKQLVAAFNDEHWEEGMEVTFHNGPTKTYNTIKAAERKLGASMRPELQASKLLDIVECELIANCSAAVMSLINRFKMGEIKSPSGGNTDAVPKPAPFELARIRSNFGGRAKADLAGLRKVTLNVIFHSSRGLHKKGDRIIGEIHITLPAFEKLRQRAGPLLRHVEREESLLAKSSELLSEASEGAAKSRSPR